MVQQGCCADIMESAFSYAGREMETEPPKTEAPETQAPNPDTQAPAQTTEPTGKSGCGSVIGFGAIAVVAAAAAAVVLKKKD